MSQEDLADQGLLHPADPAAVHYRVAIGDMIECGIQRPSLSTDQLSEVTCRGCYSTVPETPFQTAMRAEGVLPDFDPPAAGPVWTNGTADQAAAQHPHWCDRFHASPAPSGRTTHMIEILNTTVLDQEMLEEVPLTVVLERVDEPGEVGTARTVLSIGHALYQPTSVTIDGPTRARLIAAMLTAHGLEQLEIK